MTSVPTLRTQSYAVQGDTLRAALAMSSCSAGGGSNKGSSTITKFRVSFARRDCFSMQGTGAEVLGAPKHPYTRRLPASLPVPNPAEQATRREALRMLRAEDRS